MDIELIKSAITNNSEKTISQNTLKRILVQRIMSSVKINNFSYDISNLLSRLEESTLSDEQKEEITRIFYEKAVESYNDLKDTINEIFGSEEKNNSSVETTSEEN